MSSKYTYYLSMPKRVGLEQAWEEYKKKLYEIDDEEYKLIGPTLKTMKLKREQAWKEFLKQKNKILERSP